MHMEYEVKLPDDDFAVGENHKLIPSVIGDMQVVKSSDSASNAVTYSGPTYVAIRSAKHTGSSACSHLQDMKMIRSPEFAEIFNFDETKKKVMIVTVDGGPDENLRYQKTIAYFEEYQLDALFLATSVFNRIERRMAPLSREMSGSILPRETFGSHLDVNGKTIDDALKLKNFEHAG